MNEELEELQGSVNELLLKHEVHNDILALELTKLILDHEQAVTNHIYSKVMRTVQEAGNAGT